MSLTRRSTGTVALAAALVVGVGGCSGLEFTQDRRLSFTAPKAYALTHLPVTLSWKMPAYVDGRPPNQLFAVFIDRQPVKVGHSINSVLPDGTSATPALLRQAGVYVTSADHVTLRLVPDLDGDNSSRQRHYANVVLIDAEGKRVNESSWTRAFDLPRSDL